MALDDEKNLYAPDSALGADPYDGETVFDSPDKSEQNVSAMAEQNSERDNEVVVNAMLASAGIGNPEKIKFQTTSGGVVERKWNDLKLDEKLGIIASAGRKAEDELSSDELDLINSIRKSGVSAKQYLNSVYKDGVDSVKQDNTYKIDEMSDDELFVLDAIARFGDEYVSDDELEKMLSNAKKDPAIYAKTIASLRKNYKKSEDEMRYNEQLATDAENERRFNETAQLILDSIRNMKSMSGIPIELDNNDMNELANFMLTRGDDGLSDFSRMMNDPKRFTQLAFWALNGDRIMGEMNERMRAQYNRGLAEGRASKAPRLVFDSAKKKGNSNSPDVADTALGLDVK